MGGIGKTALALEAAHQARSEGWFPGGTLFVDLRGYDDNPVTSDQAVLALLDALGVHGTDLPPTAARQYDMYGTLLAERRERMLIILDNASDPSQYLPLLPAIDHHRVIITSRNRLDSLSVRYVDLETLDPAESIALITTALSNDPDDDRPSHEPEPLRELTDLCGHLPLALQIAAAMLRRRRHRDISMLVAEIQAAADPTAVLIHDGGRGTDQYGRSLTLRPVLETSYRRLPPDLARLLRLLALAPGADTSTEAAAALTYLDEGAVTGLLEDLAAAGLVTATRAGGGVQWRLHDLVRAFGAGLVTGDAGLREEGEQARERLLEFYWRWADAADDRLRWLPGLPEPERFEYRAQALAWLDGERAGLVGAVQWAGEERHARQAVGLAGCLRVYLEWRRYLDDWIAVAWSARKAAHRAGDREGEAIAWNNLGLALREAGRTDEAIDAHTHAHDLHQTTGDRQGEADAWNNLSVALREAGRTDEAIDAHTHAHDLYQTTGDRQGEGMAWNNLGNALEEAGRTDEAIDAHTHAHDLHQTIGDRHSEGMTWNNLGVTLWKAGRTDEAIEAYGKSLEIFREFEAWHRAGHTLFNLALAHEGMDSPDEARAYYLQAADAYTRANAPADAADARTQADSLP
ncbi:tetratricopeptide repeat protein [Streptomyces sp. NPDC046909]|uniref:tetratricopeptide repeat protein n=1 Tax=Streptomyces sp. NPDC046909 TaxID=3155617 RepID=UPI0033DA82DF